MRTLFLLPVILFCTILSAQEIEGSWKLTHENGEAVKDKEVVKIYQDGYFAYGAKETDTNKFLNAAGGEFSLDGETYTENMDFNTEKPTEIGKEFQYNIEWQGENQLEISDGNSSKTWERISDDSDELSGNWVITGRERNGEMNTMTPGDRRTIKILSGGRFQWAAFDSATREFHGTGGGTYSAENGKYTENITFFSRDASRVGARLRFDYKVEDEQWHHMGQSSKGDPMYEIWSPYQDAYKE